MRRFLLALAAALLASGALAQQSALVGPLQPGNNLSDLSVASTARTNLGLGTTATQNTGTSGATVPLLNGANTWGAAQAFGGGWQVLNYNASLTLPTFGGQSMAFAWNFSGGSGEGTLLNTFNNPQWHFAFYQQTSASAATRVMTLRDGGGVILPKLSAAPTTAPGGGFVELFFVAGTTGGTCKLQAIAGTSTTPVTIVDNVGAGC